jgi:O-antigen/teichoic acid export membrane protein
MAVSLAPTSDVGVAVKRGGRWNSFASRRPAVLLTASNVASQMVSFLGGLILARSLGPVGRGQVGLVQAYDETSTNVLSIGTPEATAYLTKEHIDTEARALGAALKVSLFSLPITALLGWLVATLAFADYPVGVQAAAWMAIGMTPLTNAYFSCCRMLLVSRGQIRSLAPLQMVSIVTRLVAMLVLLAIGAFTPTTAAFTFVLTGWIGNIVAWRVVKVRAQFGASVRPLLAYGIKTVPASLASMANTRLDQLLVAPLLSSAALGIYSVAIGVNVAPVAVGVAIAQAGYHTVLGTKGNSVGGAQVLRRAALAMVGCAVISAVGIFLLLEPVYGPEFRASVLPALILVPGSAATGLFLVVWSTCNAIGDPGAAGKAQVAGLIVTVVGLPFMLPWLGVPGAALVSTTAYTVRLITGLWLLNRHGVRLRLRRRPEASTEDDRARSGTGPG